VHTAEPCAAKLPLGQAVQAAVVLEPVLL